MAAEAGEEPSAAPMATTAPCLEAGLHEDRLPYGHTCGRRPSGPRPCKKKPGSADSNAAAGTIGSCDWNTAANGTTYAC